MNIIILAASSDLKSDHGDSYPFLLSETEKGLLIEVLIKNCLKLNPKKIIFALRENDIKDYYLDNIINLINSDVEILSIQNPACGAACTALLTIDKLFLEDELFIINSDEILESDIEEIINNFRKKDADGGIITFHSLHPRYSFVRIDKNNRVSEVAEKRPISPYATVGRYWFRKASDFIDNCQTMILKGVSINGKFYISLVFNEMILKNKHIVSHHVPEKDYKPLKSKKQIKSIRL